MITDEQLTERLRESMNTAVADVFPPDGLLEGVTPARGRCLRLPSLGGVVAIVATGFAAGVAVLALIVLGHARTPATQTIAPVTQPAPEASSLAALRAELAILRRPQRASDKLPRWETAAEEREHCSNCLNVATLIPRETRLLATIRTPPGESGRIAERFYLVVGNVPSDWGTGLASGWRQRGRAIEGPHLSLVGFTVQRSPFVQPADELLNYSGSPMPAGLLTPRDVMITSRATVGVVPDGVTRVQWKLANPGQRKAVTVYPRVHGNLALSPWTPAPPSTGLLNEQWLVGATWYGPGGRVIASCSIDLAQIDKGPSR